MVEILFIVCVIVLILVNNIINCKEFVAVSIVIYFFTILIVVILLQVTSDKYYKQGQVDAINGKVKYELKVQPDSARIWVKKEIANER